MTTGNTYCQPASVREAIQCALDAGENFRYIAGGTDVLVNRFQGNETAPCLIDLSGIEALRHIGVQHDMLQLGALVTLEELAAAREVSAFFPALAEAARSAASPVLRKTATLGGNVLCENRCSFYNQSEWWREAVGYCLKCDGDVCIATGGTKKCFSRFVSDTAPVLIACHAQLLVEDAAGERLLDLRAVYTGDGLQPRTLASTAVIKQIILPLRERFQCVFMKLRPRESMDFTSLTTAVSRDAAGEITIVIGGVDPGPVVVTGSLAEKEELIRLAVKKPRVVDNDVYSRPYRKEMIGVFMKRSFEQLEHLMSVP